MNRTITSAGLAAGGAIAAGFLSLGVAAAAPSNDASNPFGLTPFGPLDITSQTGDPLGNIVYGTQTFSFDSADVQPLIADFLSDHVTYDGEPLDFTGANSLIFDGLEANVIDKMQFGGTALQNLLGEQQILIPAIEGTNIESGVIDMHNWGGDFGYLYMDLVGAGDIGDANDAIGAWLVTPFGTYDVSWWEDGSFFGFPYLESRLFDVDAFNPGADFSDGALTSAGMFDWLDAFNL
jgi:hypothetical protein